MSAELLNPWMLWGAAVLAAPLLIHLLTRATRYTVWFPTLDFLRRTLARQSRLMRLRHLLLLLLRMLVIALIVAAFARPVIKLPFQKRVRQEGQTTALIALDTSLSMAYSGSGTTPLSRAKAEAEKILRALRDGDRANVLFVSATTWSALPQPTASLRLLRDEVDRAEATMEEADFSLVLKHAVEEFEQAETESARRELYLLSDFQRTNWAGVQLSEAPADVHLYLVDVDSEPKRNAALTQVRTRPASPRAGDVIEVAWEVSNYSPDPRELAVDFDLEGQRPLRRQVLVPAFGSATATFPVRADQAGDYRGVARIPADPLEADNTRHMVLRVQRSLSVVLLTDEDPGDSTTSAFYLVRALNPGGSSDAGVRVEVLDRHRAAREDLGNADAVLVSDLHQLDRDLGARLCKYMAGRGCIFYFLGRGQASPQLALLNSLNESGPVTPFTVADLLDLQGMGRGYVAWTDARFESPMLRLFRDPEHGDLSSLRFYKLRLVTDVDPHAEVLLKYEDGTVAAARQNVGEGSFVLCNFSPQPQFSDMAKHDLFPPLLHEFVQGVLAEEAAALDFEVGHVASVAFTDVPPSSSFTFADPTGAPIDARWQRVGGQVTVLFENTRAPGFYSVESKGEAVAAAPVNISPDESDLRELDGTELAAKQHMERKSHTVRADLEPAYVERLRYGRELWPMLLIAVVCVAVAEQILAYILRTR